MKPLYPVVISAFSLMLAACSPAGESSVDDAAAPAPGSATTSAPEAQATQTLTSSDGKISIAAAGSFSDRLSEAEQLLSDIPKEQLTLLQRDDAADVLIYAANLGAAKTDAASYLKKLGDLIKADGSLSGVQVDEINANQLTYRFSEKGGDATVNQACQTVHGEQIYSVCAISQSQNSDALAGLLSSVAVH